MAETEKVLRMLSELTLAVKELANSVSDHIKASSEVSDGIIEMKKMMVGLQEAATQHKKRTGKAYSGKPMTTEPVTAGTGEAARVGDVGLYAKRQEFAASLLSDVLKGRVDSRQKLLQMLRDGDVYPE